VLDEYDALTRIVDPFDPDVLDHDDHDDAGQATAEYALVLLGAALVAVGLIAWATGGGGAGKIGSLLDAVLDAVRGRVG
jgi:Flp pilus assembly pilin Flp